MTKGIRMTHEEFEKEIAEKYGVSYRFLTTYKNQKSKISTVHIICGHTWEAKAGYLLHPKNPELVPCPECNKNLINTQSFKKIVETLVEKEYIVIGEYCNSVTPIKMKHNASNCNHIFNVTPNSFISAEKRCPECSKRNTANNALRLRMTKKNFTVIKEYDETMEATLLHDECDFKFNVTPSILAKMTVKCPNLKCTSRRTNEHNFRNKVAKKYGDEFLILESYVDSSTKIRIQHNTKDCIEEFYSSPKHFLYGKTICPCKHTHSRGEQNIEKTLKENNMNYKREIVFEDCIDEGFLRFDFVLYNSNSDIFCIVEFDGVQHYESIEWFGGEKLFQLTKKRDEIKNQYCIDNGIPLIRIPYWEIDNIENILIGAMNGKQIKVDEKYLIV